MPQADAMRYLSMLSREAATDKQVNPRGDLTGLGEIERVFEMQNTFNLLLYFHFFRTLLCKTLVSFPLRILCSSDSEKEKNSHAFNNYCAWTWRLNA